jgi:hypothetical protein
MEIFQEFGVVDGIRTIVCSNLMALLAQGLNDHPLCAGKTMSHVVVFWSNVSINFTVYGHANDHYVVNILCLNIIYEKKMDAGLVDQPKMP